MARLSLLAWLMLLLAIRSAADWGQYSRRASASWDDEDWLSSYKFEIGQVIRHKVDGHFGIIYERDPHCRFDKQWVDQNVPQSVSKEQPFYKLLLDSRSTSSNLRCRFGGVETPAYHHGQGDDQKRYVAQGTHELVTDAANACRVRNSDINQHFRSCDLFQGRWVK